MSLIQLECMAKLQHSRTEKKLGWIGQIMWPSALAALLAGLLWLFLSCYGFRWLRRPFRFGAYVYLSFLISEIALPIVTRLFDVFNSNPDS